MDIAELEKLQALAHPRVSKPLADRDSPIAPFSRDGILPLSFAQQRLWFLAQFDGESTAYHMPTALRLRGALDTLALRRALDALFSRHEALRTIFRVVEGQPQVELLPAHQPFALIEYDLQGHSDPNTALAQLTRDEAFALFDLARGPLIRGRLLCVAEDDHVLLITQHHIVSDGWSVGILVSELSALYGAFVKGRSNPLLPLAVQYPDYAAWQQRWLTQEHLSEQLDYWHRTLADAPVLLTLPTDRQRSASPSYLRGDVPFELDARLTRDIRQLGQQCGATLFMTVLTAWASVLARLSGQDDVVVGTPSANRSREEIESLVGFFVNTLALRIDLSGAPSSVDLLARVRAAALAAQDHQDVPFEQVVERINPPRRLEHTPLFQVMFTWQSNEQGALDLPGLQVTSLPGVFDRLKFDLELDVSEVGDTIQGKLSYATDLFDHGTIERQVGYLHALLKAMVDHPDLPIAQIDLLSGDERALLLDTWNRTEAPSPADRCIHELFEEQVRATPDSIALIQGDQSLSYGELNARANQLAHHLIEHGIQPDDLVAICVERSVAMVVGLLAILKAGGAYVPLDPMYPTERLAQVLTDSAPRLVLCDSVGVRALGPTAIAALTTIDMDLEHAAWHWQCDANPDPEARGLTSRHLAYVIYTSGSTGTPKGVMVEHRHLVGYTLGAIDLFNLTSTDTVLQQNTLNFDLSAEEIYPALLSGAALAISKEIFGAGSPGPGSAQPSFVHLTAAHWHSLVAEWEQHPESTRTQLRGVRLINVTGDALSSQKLQVWETIRPPDIRLVNTYGPTETTVSCTAAYVQHDPAASRTLSSATIGRPMNNARIYLLDAFGQPVPLGAVGELYVGGVGVARGYLHRAELTAERFLADPFVTSQDARMYRTGDLARYLPDGNIEFLGRNDHQVKIRGFRIEPGEIEARLGDHPDVREVAVIPREDAPGEKRLVAYVVPAIDVARSADTLIGSLRKHLAATLPEFMLPAAFVTLEALPQTPNGKLDRRALPAPGEDAFAHHAYEPPQGQIEIALASIWQELLKVERIGRRDNFFELGGHSLLVVRLMERLRRVGLSTEVRTIFVAPTLADLAITLGSHQEVIVPPNLIAPDSPGLTPAMLPLSDLTQADLDSVVEHVPGGVTNIQDVYALSPLQEGILFHHLLAKDGDPYLQVKQLAFADRALLDRYLVALQQVVDRHDVLRTAFYWEGLSATTQVVLRHVPLSVIELELEPLDGPIREQLALRFDPRRHRIELSQAPLLRLAVAHDPEQDRWLVLHLLHHLIGDHLATHTIHTEVLALLTQQGHTLPTPLPFRNLIAQARLGVSQEAHESFFRAQLADISEPSLPFGLTEVHRDGGAVTESYRLLPQALNDRLRHQAHRLGISLASLCHLGWGQVIARATGLDTVVFGTVLFGRMHAGAGADHTMGLFINTLPLRLDLGETGVETSARYAHTQLANLLAHEHASLALAQRCSGVAAPAPLFSTLLNYRHNTAVDTSALVNADIAMLTGIEGLEGEARNNYPCTLCVEDYGHSLGLTAQVVESLSPERVCAYMQQALESLVDALESAPQRPVRQLDVIPATERTLLLDTWNRTATAYPADRCIHQLFEEQVRRSPDAIAVVLDEQSLTYGELNAQANRLAHYLIEQGIQPDVPVAICVERSFAMVVGLLAILKAGGAYVPLDPAYPSERLTQVLADAAPPLLLSDAAGRQALGEPTLASLFVLDIEADAFFWQELSDTDPAPHPGLTSAHLAYIIYTSGSTGVPKGTMVEHRSAVNFWQVMQRSTHEYCPAPCVVALNASFSFDMSLKGLLQLLSGHCLALIPQAIRGQGTELLDFLARHRVAAFDSTPSQLEALLDAGLLERTDYRPVSVLLGGEPIGQAMWESLRRSAIHFYNMYGPTECTVDATIGRIRALGDTPSIGRPIANARIYLLDAYGQPVPLGAVGELYIGGVGVARGYLHRPELTAERFLADPFVADTQARMYRTGDLARYLPDGNIVFLGRNDHQVKLRGFRIELGEIEARLTEHPAVRETVVLALGEADHQRLVAYVVPDTSSATTADDLVATLRTHLAAQLPDYMVPSAFVTLQALPLTPNGKLDRRALPAPGEDAFARHAYQAPEGEIEIALAALWQELLKVERVGRHDHFFELGGHSLLAVRLLNRIQSDIGARIELSTLFEHPTLLLLAKNILITLLEQEFDLEDLRELSVIKD